MLSTQLLAVDERTGAIMPFAAFAWAEPADKVLAWDARRVLRLPPHAPGSEANEHCCCRRLSLDKREHEK